MRLATILAVGVALTLLGCNPDYDCGALVYDARAELCVCPAGTFLVDGGATCASLDGGLVGDGSIDLPSAPEVSIEPATPRTDEALTVRVDRDSVDPRAELVTYDVRWLRDGMLVDGPTARVDPALTTRDEEWTVEVTPRTADGRLGPMGTAQATIGNSAPSIGTARLTSYRPIEGETTTVRASGLEDADGDMVRLEYAWRIDDTLAPGLMGSTLATSSSVAPAGSSIRVDVTPFDGTARGAPLSVWAAVLPDVTRWRELYPSRSDGRNTPMTVFDSVHRRVLVHQSPGPGASANEDTLWELPFDSADHRPVKLHPEGVGPFAVAGAVVFDPVGQRVIAFGGLVSERVRDNSVWILDTSRRGAERWSQLEVLGGAPTPRMLPAAALDSSGRLWVYGGAGSEAFADLWSLDLSRSPAVWTRHAATAGPRYGGSLVHDAVRNRLILVGGAFGESFDLYTDTVHHLDLDDPAGEFVLSPARLPASRGLAMAVVDSLRDRAFVAFGLASGSVPSRDVIALSLETLEVTTLATEGDAPDGAALGSVGWDPAGSRFVVVPGSLGLEMLASSLGVFSFDPSADSWAREIDSDDEAPNLEQASAMRSGSSRLWIVGGRDGFGHVSEDVWELTTDTGSFARITTTPDAITMRSPPARYGVVFDAGDSTDWPIALFGGRREGGGLSDTATWQIQRTAWIESTLASGSPPAARDGAATYRNRCGDVGFLGGELADGTLSAESSQLACDGPDRQRGCRWIPSVSGAGPSARAWSTVTRMADDPVAFGGRTAAGPSADVWMLEGCALGSRWLPIAPTGVGPPPRYAHVASFAPSSGSQPASVIIFGGAGARPDDLMRDAWRLVHVTSTTYRWEPIAFADGPEDELPLARRNAISIYDSAAERLLVYGGRTTVGEVMRVAGDLWELRIR